MLQKVLHLVIVFTIIFFQETNGQVDSILQPVKITPPKPYSIPKKPKKESDSQIAARYFQKKEYDKAVVLYEKLYESNPRSYYYTYYLYCLIELEEFNKAEKIAKKQIKKYPDKLKYIVDLGYVYNEAGNPNNAKKQFDKAIKEITADKSQIIELANAFITRRQLEYAILTYNKGSKTLKEYPFYVERGDLYRQSGNFNMMVEEYLNYLDWDESKIALVQNRMQSDLKDDPENEKNDYLRNALLKRVQKSPGKIYYSEMLLWLTIQQKEFEIAFLQAKSIDRRQSEEGERVFELANVCLANQEYNVAIEAFEYILKKGEANFLYMEAKIGILNARYLKVINTFDYTPNDLLKLEKEYITTLKEYGENAYTIRIMKFLGHLQAFYLDKSETAITLLYKAIDIPNAPEIYVAECKIELADILIFNEDVWEAKLLYAQVEKAFKHEPIGHLAKFKNAKLSFYIGEFDWAKAQLDVLKAATSKLIANDALRLAVLISDNIDMDSSTVALEMFAKADMLLYRNKDELALQTLDSIFDLASYHPIFDEVWYKKAEIKIRQRDFETATEYLKKIVGEYSYDITADDALYLLARITEEEFKNSEEAMGLYQQILTDYPGSLYTVDARKKYRKLRGDFNEEDNL